MEAGSTLVVTIACALETAAFDGVTHGLSRRLSKIDNFHSKMIPVSEWIELL